MAIDFRKTSHIIFFAAFLPSMSYGLGWLSAQLFPDAPFWVETLSPLAAYGLLYSLFDRFAWHWPIFRWLGIVSAPDVRGRWLGEQTSSYRDENGKNRRSRVMMEVEQTFSQVKATAYYQQWQSSHTIACFMIIDDKPVLVVMFESEPKVSQDGSVAAHKGLMQLSQPKPGHLEGTYFNANGRRGELAFKRTRYKLYHQFAAVGDK